MTDSTSISRPSDEYSRTLSPGRLIMSSKVVPGLNDFTLNSLDSLEASTFSTRQYYFKVFKRISANPGQLSDGLLGTYLWEFLLHHADEFMNHYKSMTTYERNEMACYLSEAEKYSQIMNESSYIKMLEKLTKSDKYSADLRKDIELLNYDILSYSSDDNE